MAKSDNQILLDQTLWFKINVGLFVLIGGLISFDYMEQRQSTKENRENISEIKTRVSVAAERIQNLEKVVYRK